MLNARVIGKFDEVYKLCLKLKKYKEKLRIAKKENKTSEKKKTIIVMKSIC